MNPISSNKSGLGPVGPKTVERFNKIKQVLVKALG